MKYGRLLLEILQGMRHTKETIEVTGYGEQNICRISIEK